MKAGTRLEKILESGYFAVTAEVGPPKGAVPEVIRRKAEMLKDHCDAINITDNQSAVVRMSSWSSCVILKQMGIDPVMQIVVRDRNRLAIQSDVLGAVALGIRNFLCLSGDHQSLGNHPHAKGVYDIDSIQLISILRAMRDERKFECGEEVEGEVPLFIGAAENPFADPFEYRVLRLAKKVRAGANFIQTQAIYDVDKFARWMEMVRERGLHNKVHILAGIVPLRSAAMARYMRDRVAGISIPDEIVSRMERASKEKRGKEEGFKIALEIIEAVRKIEGVHGVHIMAVEWEEIVPRLVEEAGLLPRPSA